MAAATSTTDLDGAPLPGELGDPVNRRLTPIMQKKASVLITDTWSKNAPKDRLSRNDCPCAGVKVQIT